MPFISVSRPKIEGKSCVNTCVTLAAETPPEIIKNRVLNNPAATLQRTDESESQTVCSARVKESRVRIDMDRSPKPVPKNVIILDPVAALLIKDPLMSKRENEKSCEEDTAKEDKDTNTRRLEKVPKNILHKTVEEEVHADVSQAVADIDDIGVGFPRPPN
jgi:hypothetical protein